MTGDAPAMTAAEIEKLMQEIFPAIFMAGRSYVIEDVRPRGARMRLIASAQHIRPGGTIMGPAMFQLADYGLYVAILGTIGKKGASAVTTSLSINFLRRPPARDLIADVDLFKIGKRLIVGEVSLYSEAESEMVAHATATYAIP
ncbi:MAG: PaaI family thioesterase [Hyphomicrobiaceae bacterium]|nr:MAG: PaaI family thioesterase [Hyphomicrobiaceae bacterium]